MSEPESYVAVNRAMWDERAPAHAGSPDYGQIFAHCRIDRGPWLVVPFTLLPPV